MYPNPAESPQPSPREEPNLELMIRAHHQIRTLEEDNQILRMHIDLLTKDSRDIGAKLQRAEDQRAACLKENEELKRRNRELLSEVELLRAKVQAVEKLSVGGGSKLQDASVRKPQFLSEWGETTQEGNEKKAWDLQVHQQRTPCPTQLEQLSKSQLWNESFAVRKQPFQQTNDTTKSPKPQKCLQNQAERLQNKLHRNLSHQNLSNTANYPYTFSISQNDSKFYTNSSFLVNQNSTRDGAGMSIRPRSPQIRRNSPMQRAETQACEFHHSREQNLSVYSPVKNSGESGLVKKFNYTSWRKNNNNLMVWRSPTAANPKHIHLNR